jgi:hypothetical protein
MKALAKRFYLKSRSIPIPLSLEVQKINLPFETQKVILNDINIVLNFDDLSPVTESNVQIGHGGLNDTIWRYYNQILAAHPDIGVTHFLVPNFITNNFLDTSNLITSLKNQEWLRSIKEYSKNYKTEFSIHGLHHRENKNKLFSRNTEFAFLRYAESVSLINKAKKIFETAEINFKGFRPPGWDINSDFSLINALIDTGFEYCALNSYDGGLNSNLKRVSNFHPTIINNAIVNFPDNIQLDWSLEKMVEVSNSIINSGGFISIKGHFAIKDLTNSLNEINCNKLIQFLNIMKVKYGNSINFETFETLSNKITGNA